MSIKTPLQKDRIRTHFTYGIWKYALLVVAAIFGWNLIYTTTAYRPPDELKVEFYVVSGSANRESLEAEMAVIHQEVLPDMEQVSVVTMMGGEDPNAVMQLSVYVMAGDGDVYLLPYSDFYNYAKQGAFMPLDEYVESGALNIEDLDVSRGYQTIEIEDVDNESHLYGIPTKDLNGFIDNYFIDSRDMVLCILYRNGNDENSVKFMDYMVQKNRAEVSQVLQEAAAQAEAEAALQAQEDAGEETPTNDGE